MKFVYSLLALLIYTFVSNAQNVAYQSLHTAATFNAVTIDVGKPVGSTAGEAGVSPTGGATYSIPIVIPPGTNGVAPSVSLEYNSQSGPGIAGMGWNLSGMSAISRVPQNVYFDGQARPVQLDSDDRFALDGQRLVLKTGTYGANGSTYGTEVEDFSTVTVKAMTGSSPQWFEILTKDGVKMRYGNSADSRFANETGSVVMMWMLSRVIYPDNNYVDYQYDITAREPRLTKILYTGNTIAPLAPYNEIAFDYKVRQEGSFSDIRTVYMGGSAVVSRYLLDKITVKAEGTSIKSYQFTYGHDEVNSYLKSVQESNGSGVALNPTIFKYGDPPVVSTLWNNSVPSGNIITSFSGDYNGDGLPDLLTTTSTEINDVTVVTQFKTWTRNQTTGAYSLLATQDIPQTSTYSYFGTNIPGIKQPFESDVNGDGLSDVSVFALQNLIGPGFTRMEHILHYTAIPGSNSFSTHQQPAPFKGGNLYNGIQPTGDFVFQGDFDGNGLTDQVFIFGKTIDNSDPTIFYYDNQGGVSYDYHEVMTFTPFNGQLRNAWWLANEHQVIDFNGDGRQDLILFWDDWVEIFTFDSPTHVRSLYNSSSFPISTPSNHLRFGDFNGDGKMDVLIHDSNFNSFVKGISTGNGFIQSTVPIVKHWENYDTFETNGGYVSLGDFNGDGKSDFYFWWRRNKYPTYEDQDYPYTRGVDIYYSTGDGFFNQQVEFDYVDGLPRVAQPSPVRFFPVDINGDGRTDIADRTSNYTNSNIRLINENGHDHLIVKIKDGFNNTSEWDYKKMTDAGSFYSRGATTSSYPINVVVPVINAVNSFKSSDGIGGQREQSFAYQGATAHRAGKGMLGFTKTTVTDWVMNIRTQEEMELNSTYFVMVPKGSAAFLLNDAPIGSNTLSYTLESAGAKRFWLKTNSIAQFDALSGVTTTTSLLYDAYANATKQTVTIPGVHTHVTDTEFGAYPSGTPNKPTLVTTTQTRSGESPFQTKTKLDYNSLGQLTSKIDFYQQGKAVATTFGYNGLGNPTSTSVSASGITTRATSAVYDDKGRYPLQTTNALSQQSTTTYDAKWGTPLTVTGTDGLTTSYQYDTWGRLTKTTFPEGYDADVTLHWDVNNAQRFYRRTVTAGQPTTKTWYDQLGREIRTETEGLSGDWSIQTQSYDARGNVHTVSEPHYASESYFITTTNQYDAYNRITSVQHSAFGTTTYGYGYSGGKLTVTTTSPSGTTSQTTDAAGMLTGATDDGGTLSYTYYSHGGLKTVSNGSVSLTTSEYDAYGRQTKLIDVNAGATEYDYDALGQLIWQKTAKGDQTTLQYNLLGQVTTRTGTEGTTTYTYGTTNSGGEIKNRIKSITGFAGTFTSYTYNILGQLTQLTENNGGSHTTSYTYNTIGDVSTVSYPSGLVITNQYNSRGYLDEIKHGGTVLYKTNTTNGRGQVTGYKRANNTITSAISYTNGFPVAYTTAGIQHYELTWDYQKGNLTSRKDARSAVNKAETFTYDHLQRLTGASISGGVNITAGYAANGNLSSKTDAGTYSYHANKIHAVTGVTNPSPSPVPTLQQDITYTPFMQAETVAENGYLLTYTYGADYSRSKSELKQGSTTIHTRYYYEAGYERDITGSTTRYIQYISSPAGLIALIESVGGNHTVRYTFTDHLGSILTVTNSSGSIEAEQSFDAWGRRRNSASWALLSPTATTSLPVWLYRGYTAHEHLDQFGLINMNGRMYDPVLGRMLSPDNYVPDPLFTQDYNRYTYARNNPLVYTDPDGNFWNFVIGGVMGGVAGWQIGKAQGAKGWGMFGYILGGATIGVATAGIGQGIATATSSWGAIGSGISTGAGAGFIGGGLNAVLAGSDPRTGAAKGAVWGAAIGGALGVVNAAIGANKTIGELAFDSNNLDLTGKSVDFTRDSFDNFLNETGLDPDAVNTRTYLSSERVPSGLSLDEKSQFFTKQMNGETKYIAGVVREGSFAQRLVSNKTSTFIAAGAFRSDKYLYLVTGHEFIHAYHASLGINIWDGSSNTQFSERSAYGWSIMASKSINYPYSLNTFRSHWSSFNFKLSGAPSGRFHWKFVPGIIKR